MTATRLPGVAVKIGARELVMPALPAAEVLEHFRVIRPLVERAMKETDPVKNMAAAYALLTAEVAMIHSALVRNHPELQVAELEDELGQFQIVELFNQLCRHSGSVGGAMLQAGQRSKVRA